MSRVMIGTIPGMIYESLYAAGVHKRRDQAAIIGESDVQWSRYLNGHRSPKCSKVQRWLAAAEVAGHPIRLEWGANGACVASSVPERDGA